MSSSRPPSGIITLLTDFGASDPFVGIMKGVILSGFRAATIVDLCHGIRPQSVAEGAFWLERSYRYFPPGTLHVAVVDPTVGSARRILAARADGHLFLAPDNGLLPGSVQASAGGEVWALDARQLGIRAPSATFHGRDVFAPVAARLASGALEPSALGPHAEACPCVLEPAACDEDGLLGTVVTVDRFGNLITNVSRAQVESAGAQRVLLGDHDVPLRRTYADVDPGELVALLNAFDVVEIAVRDGSAEGRLALGRHTPVRLPAPGKRARV